MNTELEYQPLQRRVQRGQRKSFAGVIITILLAIVFTVFGIGAWLFLVPNGQEIQVYSLEDTTMIIDHQIIGEEEFNHSIATIVDNKPFVSYEFVKSYWDPYLFWDEANQLLIMTTETIVLEMETEQLTAFVNDQPIQLEAPVTVIDGLPYLPIDFFAEYYNIVPVYYPNTNTVIINTLGVPIQKGLIINEKSDIRLDATIKEPIVAKLSKDSEIAILGEKGMWYRVQTEDGIIGYGKKTDIQLAGIFLHKEQKQEASVAWKPIGGKINLTWEQVHSKTPNTDDIPPLNGVNVVSPTWFHLKDQDGNISGDKASLDYVEWAHEQGMHVWALYSNQFDPDLTREFLSNPAARKKSIAQILGYAKMYQLDGVNIDFENVYYEDRDLLTQYIRELSPYLREQELVVSIDVTILSQSRNWSMVYDRIAYADTVDYVMVMTYDEHWGSSPVAGSVASLPWVEKGLQGVLEQVPKEKLILGVPFYTRIWKEEPQSDGSVKVTSRAVSMQLAMNTIEENQATIIYDEISKQKYAEYYEGDIRYRIWLETTDSMAERVKLVRQYDLAGIASWSRGFEQPEIWDTIRTFLEKQPVELVLNQQEDQQNQAE